MKKMNFSRHIMAGFRLPKWLHFGLLMLAFPLWATPLVAQTAVVPFPNREIGLRAIGLRNIHALSTIDTMEIHRENDLGYGLDAFYVKRNEKATFWRAALGFSGLRESRITNPIVDDMHRQTTTMQREFRTNASFAIGKEIPQMQRRFWERFRLRTGLSLFTSFTLISQDKRVDIERDTSGILRAMTVYKARDTFGNTSGLQVFFQAEFRLAKQFYFGLEWSYGPYLSIISKTQDQIEYGDATNSFDKQSESSVSIWLPNSLSVPSLSIGYSF